MRLANIEHFFLLTQLPLQIEAEDLEHNYNTFQCQGCSLYVTVEGYRPQTSA
jgi:hypothetical protein